MKTKYILGAFCAVALGFASCSETWDDSPVLKTHEGEITANFLNVPQMQSAPVMITEANNTSNFNLTCSQPDFGYAAAAAYQVQMSLTEDFASYQEIKQRFYDCSQINPLYSDVAATIENLNGVRSEEDLPLEYKPYYVRLKAFIPESESNTVYISNVVKYDAISADYLAIWVPDVAVNMYLRGNLLVDGEVDTSWGTFPQYQFYTGPDEDSWICENVTLTAGTQFKVADSSWGDINLGADATSSIEVDQSPVALLNGNSGNLTAAEDFTGTVVVTLSSGVYYIQLVTDTDSE